MWFLYNGTCKNEISEHLAIEFFVDEIKVVSVGVHVVYGFYPSGNLPAHYDSIHYTLMQIIDLNVYQMFTVHTPELQFTSHC